MYFFLSNSLKGLGLMLLFMVGAHAQSMTDSLKNKLGSATDQERMEIFFQLFRIENGKSNDLALGYATEAFEIAYSLGDSFNIVRMGRARGNSFVKMGKPEDAIQLYITILGVAKRNAFTDQEKFLLNSLALAHTDQADYDKALDYNFQSLLIREKEGKKDEISVAYNNIGLVYFKLKDWQQALAYFTRSYKAKEEGNIVYDKDRCLINIGLCHVEMGLFDEAIQDFNKAFSLCNGQGQCPVDILTEGHYGLGKAYMGKGKNEDAEKEFIITYKLAKNNNSLRILIESLLGLRQLYYVQGNIAKCHELLREAESIVQGSNLRELEYMVYKEMANLYNREEDYKNATLYQGKYIDLKDSVYSEELLKNLTKVQTRFEERENIQTIVKGQEALARQRNLNIAIAIIALLAGTLVFVLNHSNRVKKKVNKDLSEAKITIEEQNKKLVELNRDLNQLVEQRTEQLQVANNELTRVNRELDNFIYKTSHDIRGPLASLRGICAIALMDVKEGLAIDYLKKLEQTADTLNIILTRLQIVNQINNSTISPEWIDFESLIKEVIEAESKKGVPSRFYFSKDIGMDIRFQSDRELIRIILTNLVDNAIKFHNDSSRIDPFAKVAIHQEDGKLAIRVIDNGIGLKEINPEKVFQMFSRASERSTIGGIGLYLTKIATEKLGGIVGIRTTQEGFTEFSATFSVEET